MVVDLSSVDESGHVLDLGIGPQIDLPIRRPVKDLEIVEDRCSGPAPVAGPLVTAPVLAVVIDEHIQAAKYPSNVLQSFLFILFQKQCRGQPVGVDPGVPVVDSQFTQHRMDPISHPPEVVAGSARLKDTPVGLLDDPGSDQGRYLIEFVPDQVERPGQQGDRFGRKEIDGRFLDVGQARPVLLYVEMSRDTPVGFLARAPDTVDDVVDKPVVVLDALGDDQAGQRVAACVAWVLVACAIAVSGKFEEEGGG